MQPYGVAGISVAATALLGFLYKRLPALLAWLKAGNVTKVPKELAMIAGLALILILGACIAGALLLTERGKDPTVLISFAVMTLGPTVVLLLNYSISRDTATAANTAVEALNGTLEPRIEQAVNRVLEARSVGQTPPPAPGTTSGQ